MISAQLDGEADAGERAATEAHLAGCGPCRVWLDAAAAVTRLARTRQVDGERASNIRVDELLAAVPTRRRWRWRWSASAGILGASRLALGFLGAVQVVLGVAQIVRLAAAPHLHPVVGAAVESGHLWHESAAWNVAVGAGFVWVALQRRRPVGVLPILTAFLLVLTLLTAGDVVAGRVGVQRVFSHGFLVLGYLLLVVVSRSLPDGGAPPAQRGSSRWRLRLDEEDAGPVAPVLRLLPGGRIPEQARGRREAA